MNRETTQDNDGICRAQVDPVLGRILVELPQHVGVFDDLGHRLRVLGAVVNLEGLDRDLGLVDILGVIDLPHRRERAGMCRFRQCGKDVGLLVHQHRCSRVAGNTSRTAFQNRSAPSPTASTGAVMPRRRQSRSRSAHDSVDSR
jgi:hypothetical protein